MKSDISKRSSSCSVCPNIFFYAGLALAAWRPGLARPGLARPCWYFNVVTAFLLLFKNVTVMQYTLFDKTIQPPD
jgi:hypothetical protein